MKLDPAALNELLAFHYDRREIVYQFLTGLSNAEFTRDMKVGWDSIQYTLLHCLSAEDYWIQYAVLGHEKPRYRPADYPDLAAMRTLAAAVRERTAQFLAPLAEADLAREYPMPYKSDTPTFPLSRALLHVVMHDVHHRGQVLAMARQLGYEPPEIDFM